MKKDHVEHCARCGVETKYTDDDPVEFRKYYIEGAGQLCEKCYAELYDKAPAEGEKKR